MTFWKSLAPFILSVGFVLLIGMIGLVTVENTSLVDWRDQRAIAFESDDWGLAGFIPDAEVWEQNDRQKLDPGAFPAVYWESTLEDSSMVNGLCRILGSVQGNDGLPAVFQPNYVMSSLAYESDLKGYTWNRYDWPNLPKAYQRPGLTESVSWAIEQGVWYPEFHATWHYDPVIRLEAALSTDFAREMTKRGVTLFPGSEKARELGPWRSTSDLKSELLYSSQIFEKAFGRPIGSVIAPDYTWNARMESIWQNQGIGVLQAKKEQRDPTLLPGKPGRIQKFVRRKIDLLVNRQRFYLERNCRLEPVQAPDVDFVVEQCLTDTRKAWRQGYPAIVETHRVNFAHYDSQVVKTGQDAFQKYLSGICQNPHELPVFMVDVEIAQLQARGVSWVVRGDKLVLRNGTHSRRMISVSLAGVERIFMIPAQKVIITNW